MIYSVSHTDLDGFGSQFVIAAFYNNVKYYNVDYGDVANILDSIYSKITNNDVLYVTDLNLTLDISKKLDSARKAIGFKIQLLDHHITGMDSAEIYDWYHLDTKICATKITYNYMTQKFPDTILPDWLKETVDMINVYDMWIKKDKLFRKSQLLSNTIFESKLDSSKNSQFMINLIKKVGALLQVLSVQEVEKVIPSTICEILSNLTTDKNLKRFINSKNISTTVKLGTFPVETLREHIYISKRLFGVDVIFFKDISSRTSQYAFDYLLDSISYKDSVLVKYNSETNTLSCRSRNSKAVEVAKLFGGGGHPDAAGAKFEGKLEDYLTVN